MGTKCTTTKTDSAQGKIRPRTHQAIPYRPCLHQHAGSIPACVLMQQLEYWFNQKPDGFYKFLEPCPGQRAYKKGDSWCEEMQMTPDEFRHAFDKIGIRYLSKRRYDQAVDRFQGKYYCSYTDKISRITWYFRNHAALGALNAELAPYDEEVPLRKRQKPDTGLEKSSPNSTETTKQRIHQETTTQQPVAARRHKRIDVVAEKNGLLLPSVTEVYAASKTITNASVTASGADGTVAANPFSRPPEGTRVKACANPCAVSQPTQEKGDRIHKNADDRKQKEQRWLEVPADTQSALEAKVMAKAMPFERAYMQKSHGKYMLIDLCLKVLEEDAAEEGG